MIQQFSKAVAAVSLATMCLFILNPRVDALAEPGRSADTLPDLPDFSTLAGSGGLGFTDGNGKDASFVAPAAVAYDASGNLLVADRDGQRIRSISTDGTVRTIAGAGDLYPFGSGTGGGYLDGPALQARFNAPQGVLALPDGTILVADTKNFCLRTIRNGVVSTFAGNHLDFTGADGPLAVARFSLPRSLARTPDGAIFVADPPNGVRRIANGVVSTLHFADSPAVVAVTSVPGSPHLIAVATATTIETIDTNTSAILSNVPLESGFVQVPPREGGRPFGPPSSIAAYSATEFVVTDPLASAVRLVQVDLALGDIYTRVLTQTPDENAAFGDAGFRDGPGAAAKVDEPLGIAISPQGSIAIADTGNRRIRTATAFNHTTHISVDLAKSELPATPNPKEYRIALVGNSYIWFDQSWHESVPGIIEDDLRSKSAAAPRQVRVYPIMRLGLPTIDALSLVDNELADGNFDMVIVDVSNYGQIFSDETVRQQFPDGWESRLSAALASTAKNLAQAHEQFLIVTHPGAADFPDEFAYRHLPKGMPSSHGDTVEQRDPYQIELYHDQMNDALAKSGSPILDLWPAFLESYGAQDRQPLFESWDHHLSPTGRKIVADSIAREIQRRLTVR